MLINNIDISKYNARVLDVNIQNSSISNLSDSDMKNKLIPILLNSQVYLNNITVTLLINSLDKKQYYLDKSNLISIMLEPFDIYFKDRNLKFKCVLVNQADQASLRQIRGRFQLTFIGYNLENEITETFNKTTYKTIDVHGTSKIPIVMEITPSIDMTDLKINGVSDDPLVVKNLKANKKIIIDGIGGTVLQDGINKFEDTDMWEFPFLVPGKNNISASKDTCNITIKYNPRFI
ncbi:MAG: phage tail family protein [Paraclostridium bifermentans]|uniref:phage distal tail protein n=1 Tax=Paraclostridium bifermentans TaxID=1490 RepID=UPI001D869B92|nr:phage tail domain-containing protein [Paraclostridium bifermentans]MBS6509712.1 phage tail family protein [Paraclostridium bifermentans]